MGFSDEVRKALSQRIGQGSPFANKKQMADALNLDPSQLGRFLKGERGLTVESLGRVLDGLGARLEFADRGAAREVCFVSADKADAGGGLAGPRPEDYLAVPLVDLALAASPDLVPEERVQGWLLVWRRHKTLAGGGNLVAVQVADNDRAMSPTLSPGDLVLVDRSARDPGPGGAIMLVRTPGGAALIRRVSVSARDGDQDLVFYAEDQRQTPPLSFSLARHYGNDPSRAIAGTILWAWSDMRGK